MVMNTFNESQLKILTMWAEAYFDRIFPPRPENPQMNEMLQNARTLYVESSIADLTDPSRWEKR